MAGNNNGTTDGRITRIITWAVTGLAIAAIITLILIGGRAAVRNQDAGRALASSQQELKTAHKRLDDARTHADAKARADKGLKDPAQAAAPSDDLYQSIHTNDDTTMGRFFSEMFTWNSTAQYTAARDDAIGKWGLGDRSDFVVRLMQPDKCNTDATKKTYCRIDMQKLASDYTTLNSTMSGYDNGVRTYVGTVSTLIPGHNGGDSTPHDYQFAWTIGRDGNLLAVDWINGV